MKVYTGVQSLTYESKEYQGVIEYQCCKCGGKYRIAKTIQMVSHGQYHALDSKTYKNQVEKNMVESVSHSVVAMDECLDESINKIRDYSDVEDEVKCPGCGCVQPWSSGSYINRKAVSKKVAPLVYYPVFNDSIRENERKWVEESVYKYERKSIDRGYIKRSIHSYLLISVFVLLISTMFFCPWIPPLIGFLITAFLLAAFAFTWVVVIKRNINATIQRNNLSTEDLNVDLNDVIVKSNMIWVGRKYIYLLYQSKFDIILMNNISDVYVGGIGFSNLIVRLKDGCEVTYGMNSMLEATNVKRAIRIRKEQNSTINEVGYRNDSVLETCLAKYRANNNDGTLSAIYQALVRENIYLLVSEFDKPETISVGGRKMVPILSGLERGREAYNGKYKYCRITDYIEHILNEKMDLVVNPYTNGELPFYVSFEDIVAVLVPMINELS